MAIKGRAVPTFDVAKARPSRSVPCAFRGLRNKVNSWYQQFLETARLCQSNSEAFGGNIGRPISNFD